MSLNGINLPEKHLQTDDSQEGNDESSMWTYKWERLANLIAFKD